VTEKNDRREKITRIRALPGAVEAAIRGLNEAQLDTPYRDGGWTVRQVVHHLADSHANAIIRMKLIMTENTPTLKPYDQDEWAKLKDTTLPVEPSLSILKGLHERWACLLESISPEMWSRSAHHPESGKVSLDDLLNTYSRHGENHVRQITDLRKSKRW
jgi:hypothetical protein